MKLVVEQWCPRWFGIAAAVIGWMLPMGALGAIQNNILSDAISFSAIIVGFLASAQAILASMGDKQVLKNLRRTKNGQTLLVDYFGEGVGVTFTLAALSIAMKLLSAELQPIVVKVIMASWAGLAAWSVAAAWRVVHIFGVILKV